jgi:hypothetical protein
LEGNRSWAKAIDYPLAQVEGPARKTEVLALLTSTNWSWFLTLFVPVLLYLL